MRNSKFNQVREVILFGDSDSLDLFEDPDQLFDNFVYEIYGSDASKILSGLNSQEMQ